MAERSDHACGIHVTPSNDLETLASVLASLIADEGDPLTPALVVVPNPGTGRWLMHHLATQQGIAAHIEQPLPASFFWRVLRAWLPEVEADPFDRETLAWRIQARLPDFLDKDSRFQSLTRYVSGDDREMRLFQLSRRIAEVFDQYLVYRPDWVLQWERDEQDDHWQAVLWRAVAAGDPRHRARLVDDLCQAMSSGGPADDSMLPRRIHLFGINSLPPVYLEVLRLLGRHRQVLFFHLNPCRLDWREIRSERALARHDDPQSAYLELGNPLLASFGHVGQVFFEQLASLDGGDAADGAFLVPQGGGVLHRVQRDILELRDGRAAPQAAPEEHWPSLQFHGVHTRFREIQVLHDNLLRCLETLEGLTPRDILVMAPDMAAYAPFVEAVFGTAEEARFIPFSIGDRSTADDPLAEAVSWLLALPSSRITASEVLALLETDALRCRFGLDAEAVEAIRRWIAEGGIRWGIDDDHRADLGLPGDAGLHGWRFGLRRLFLGYVTPADETDALYTDGTAPYLDIDSGELLWVGALQTLIDRLDHWRKALAQARDLAQWQVTLAALFEDFFAPDSDDDRSLLQGLHQRLDDLVAQTAAAGFVGSLPVAVVQRLIDASLEDTTPARGFLDGGVTFSNLLPMRALPYRVICLLGMNDSDFPRRQRPVSFDLMARHPWRGDRDRRRDDRYLFLETLVSARDCLLISWQSRDVRSNDGRLPAEVVSELTAYIDDAFVTTDGVPLSEKYFVQHPLQPFSPRHYDGSDPRLFSYDPAWAVATVEAPERPFIETACDAEVPDVLDIADLIAFFHNPARVFLERSLGIRLPADETAAEDVEPFRLDSLGGWQSRHRLLHGLLRGGDAETVVQRLRGEGWLPHGEPGRLEQESIRQQAERFYCGRLQPLLERHPSQQPLLLDIPLGATRLVGRIDRCSEHGVFDFRVGRLRPRDRLGLWIRHLAVAAQRGSVTTSDFVAEDGSLRLDAIDAEKAREHLADLLALYRQGLAEPLKFYPETAWAFVEGERGWESKWHGGWNNAGEAADPAYALALRGVDPLDEAFGETARRVYDPLRGHSRSLVP